MPESAHRAMVQAIETMAPMAEHDRDDPLHRYAFLREADHLWALGDIDRTLACLCNRVANIPRENLERWRPWLSRFRERFDEDHPTILNVRGNVAYWTGETGDAGGALRLSSALLPDQERVLGRDHPNTLTTRGNIASWTGKAGDARGALRLSSALLPDQERVLGRDHPNTLTTRSNIASWTGADGRRAWGAAAVLRAVAGPGAGAGARPPRHAHQPQQHRVLDRRDGRRAWGAATLLRAVAGPGAGAGARPPQHAHHPLQHRALDRQGGQRAWGAATLLRTAAGPGAGAGRATTPRRSPPAATSRTGPVRRAMRVGAAALLALLPDRERVLGRDHPDTLTTRHNIADWTGEAGDARGALQLFSALLPDQERVLGRDHPNTLTTRHNIAYSTGEAGDARGRCGCSRSCCRTGSGCWGATTPTRSPPATTSRPGLARWATRVARCNSSPHCCRTGSGCWGATTPTRSPPAATSRTGPGDGRRAWALRLSSALLPDRERVLGRDHPDTLTTRHNIAHWTGEMGDARGRCNSSRHCCRTRSGCWGPTTPTRSPPAATSRPGPARRATRVGRCGCPPRCCRTWSGCWGATTPTRSPPATTSRTRPARRATRVGRCNSSPHCCRTRSGCWGATAPTRSPPAATSRTGPVRRATRVALRLFTELLPDQERVLGATTPTRSPPSVTSESMPSGAVTLRRDAGGCARDWRVPRLDTAPMIR